MDKSIVACFSHNKNNSNLLLSELKDYFGNTVNYECFNTLANFLKLLERDDARGIALILLDIDNDDDKTMQWVNKITNSLPQTVKIILGENCHLLNIQLGINQNQFVHYLKRPWDKTDLLLILNSASAARPYFQTNTEAEDFEIREKIEVEVSKRLKELIEANFVKDKFLSIIAHDLKSPFLGLLGVSEILLRDWDELSEANKIELIDDIRKTSEETYKLLVDLLDWAKVQREKLEIAINEIMVHNVVDSSIKISEYTAIHKGIKFQNDINSQLKVNADEKMISTVFRNLISNAVKHTQPGGKIKISAKEEENYCTFCVSDDGNGITKKDILELFSPKNLKKISRNIVDGNLERYKKSYNGYNGLGLILCKDFVEKNGGKIWVETRKGEGSKFYFTVPC